MVCGLPSFDHVEQFCDVCVLTKQRRLPFPSNQASGPRSSSSSCTGIFGSKREAANAIRCAQAPAEAECDHKLCVLRTDNDGEFTAAEFTSYCADEGGQRHYSASYNPHQIGIVERRN
jgi:hypothetical protein